MRRFLIVLSLCALVLMLPAVALAQQGETIHIVGVGESLELIAARYGVAASAIASRNGLVNFGAIYAGQPLVIPSGFDSGGGQVPVPSPTPIPPTSFIYTVQPGDYVSVLALRFGTTTAAIAAANGLLNPNFIFAGQQLLIPSPFDQGGGQIPIPPPIPPILYTVRPGDRLTTIAAQFGTTVAAIANANNIFNVNRIFAGQILTIPQGQIPVPPPAQFTSYVVRQGDTINTIAARFGTTLRAILNVNPQIVNPGRIFPGDVLRIPLF